MPPSSIVLVYIPISVLIDRFSLIVVIVVVVFLVWFFVYCFPSSAATPVTLIMTIGRIEYRQNRINGNGFKCLCTASVGRCVCVVCNCCLRYQSYKNGATKGGNRFGQKESCSSSRMEKISWCVCCAYIESLRWFFFLLSFPFVQVLLTTHCLCLWDCVNRTTNNETNRTVCAVGRIWRPPMLRTKQKNVEKNIWRLINNMRKTHGRTRHGIRALCAYNFRPNVLSLLWCRSACAALICDFRRL